MELMIADTIAMFLFTVGLYGVMSSKVGIKMLISIEILINSAVLALVASSYGSMQPIILALMVIAIAAVESVIGISILIAIFRRFGKVNISLLKEIRE
ncbi:MAG: NADH-quinone oxidoreductase subunit NuoK [Thermoplasmata archaeon]|jgi:NADH-quinone oxidoreductase subunit K|nr:NADH-quinone oxidoreductase subunit NuoK [Candidatus Thermoplasmatota archaeon]